MSEQQAPNEVIDALIGAAAAGLAIAFPAIPAPAWLAILTAVRNGDIILADIEAIAAAKGIKLQYDLKDFPAQPNQTPSQANKSVNFNQSGGEDAI